MNLPDPRLRLPIALMLASLLIGTVIFHFSLNARMAAEARLIAEKSQASQAARSVREAPARLIQDQAETSLHDTIRASGFLGPEDRVGWISALAQTQAQFQLASLSWHLSPQTVSTLMPDLNISKLEFTVSTLTPSGLSQLIAHLRATAPGRFTVERCELALDPQGDSGQANCLLNWWTLTPDAS